MSAGLSFEQAPPVSVPLRFILSAPLFGIAAGVALTVWGPQVVESRWTGQTLSAVHLLVAGFMLQAMVGALFQFLPVAAGGNIWRPLPVASVLHLLLVIAALLLAVGLASGMPFLLRAAALAFFGALLGLAMVVGIALARTPAEGATVWALRLAVIGLVVTVGLGVTLAEGLAGGHSWPLADMTDVHAAWGLLGWALMLLVGVSYFVVPMFQLTPAYPALPARGLPPLLFAVLLAWTLQLWLPIPRAPLLGALAALAAAFAVVTLRLQQARRRRVADAVFRFFRLAMACLLAASLLMIGVIGSPAVADAPATPWLLGVLLIVGMFMSAIAGMMFKIVPFICWLELQRCGPLGAATPHVGELLPSGDMLRQYRLHQLVLLLLLAAACWPSLAYAAGLALAIASASLAIALMRAVGRYARVKARTAAVEPSRKP